MDAIHNQTEKEKHECIVSLYSKSKSHTERSVSFGPSNEINSRKEKIKTTSMAIKQ
jgi:hypothetical protein